MKSAGMVVFLIGIAMFVSGIGGCVTMPNKSDVAFGFLILVGLIIAGAGLDTIQGRISSTVIDDECNCCDNCDTDCDCECHD